MTAAAIAPPGIDHAAERGMVLDGTKLAWHKERVEAWQRGERIAPITIDCALTRSCTYKCVYCYATLQDNDIKRMTRDVIFRFLDDAAEIGVKAISFVSDGESTCSPFLEDAIVRGHRNGLDMALGTNGYLLKDERLADILPALTYLRFNVSAGTPERYAEIHGCEIKHYRKVMDTVRKAVAIKRERGLAVTIGLQMVLMPQFADQIIPLTELGRELGVDYLVIKHCSDDEYGSLGVDYSGYFDLVDLLNRAEAMSTPTYAVKAKWSKILSGGKRCYHRCYGPPLMLQMSGSGLVAPCGMLFNERYQKNFHIGNIVETPFKELWRGERYWEVMNRLASPQFDAQKMCGTLCLQHKVNESLYHLVEHGVPLPEPQGEPPMHLNFV